MDVNAKSNGNARLMTCGCALLALLGTSAVHAAIQVGGGASLPAIGYVGNVAHRLNYAPDAVSMFGAYKAVTGTPVSYCRSDSIAGKNVLAGVSGYNVQLPCPDGPTIPKGFGASDPHVNRSSLTQPDFAASDLSLSSTDYANYVANHAGGRPLQFPALAGSIAIVYRNDNTTTQLNLTTAQVCGIFNGAITTWTALGLPVPATGDNTLHVVYRSDSNGTSFGFSNFLSANCAGTPAVHFSTNQSFASAVALYGLPSAAWSGQASNEAVLDMVLNSAVDGYIGYSEATNAAIVAGQIALVNGKDPLADIGDPVTHKLTISSADLIYNYAITGADANTGRPVLAPISGGPVTSCIALVKPNAYATQATGYPIVTISYLLGNSRSNGADLADVRRLLGAPYNAAIISATGTVGGGTGLAFLSTPITQAQVDGCVID